VKAFRSEVPSICSDAVKPLRTRDEVALVGALGAVKPPIAADVAAELVVLAIAHRDADVRKKASALATKHVKDLAKFKGIYKTLANAEPWVLAARVRAFKHPYRLDIAKAIMFHRRAAGGIPFEQDAAIRGALLDEIVARAERDGEPDLQFGEVYLEWDEHGGKSMGVDLHELPAALFGELAARRKRYPFSGLSFESCSLDDLPAELANTKSWLKSLNLGYNAFAKLPPVLWKLENLETLVLFGTELADIPPDIAKLKKLRSLDIGNMKKMKEIPASVCKLDRVEYLRIGNGSIHKVPDAIGGMKSLRELELQSTQVRKLPPILFDMPSLKKVNVRWSKVDDATVEKLAAAGKEVER